VPLISVACTSVGVCTAVGSCGTIVHTDDGSTWTTQRPPNCSGESALQSVAFSDAEHGAAVGIGRILTTNDGGANWDFQASPTDQELHSVVFVDGNLGFIGGGHQDHRGTVLRTTDGGVSWTPLVEDIPSPIEAVAFADATHGLAVTLAGDIYRTSDGGENWVIDARFLANLYGISYRDGAKAEVVGFSSYNAAILGWDDRVFGNGFD
jgi:photosystem II stability/assembly factor-like uncharacterized protein